MNEYQKWFEIEDPDYLYPNEWFSYSMVDIGQGEHYIRIRVAMPDRYAQIRMIRTCRDTASTSDFERLQLLRQRMELEMIERGYYP